MVQDSGGEEGDADIRVALEIYTVRSFLRILRPASNYTPPYARLTSSIEFSRSYELLIKIKFR